jgi:hypothetical protein
MKHTLPALFATLLTSPALLAAAPPAASCQAQSSATPPRVVELYTSEGCSSCPPADRWLSTLKGKSDVLALSFHVTYWDRLGWPDRFASSEFTQRQYAQAQRDGSAQVYTPQVVVQGRDWRQWPQLPAAAADPAAPAVTLVREGDAVTATVSPVTTRGAAPLAAYWAVLEDGHQTAVRAGENAGERLRHDHVVRLLKPVAAWPAANGVASTLSVSRGDPAFPRRVVLVVTDAASQRPVQAVALGC